jgi:hypothetical protein
MSGNQVAQINVPPKAPMTVADFIAARTRAEERSFNEKTLNTPTRNLEKMKLNEAKREEFPGVLSRSIALLSKPFTRKNKTTKQKQSITRKIMAKFKAYQVITDAEGEYARAGRLVKRVLNTVGNNITDMKVFKDYRPLSELLILTIVKLWRNASEKEMVEFKRLKTSVSSKCTQNWLGESLTVLMNKINKPAESLDEAENSKAENDMKERYLKWVNDKYNTTNFTETFQDDLLNEYTTRLTTLVSIASVLAFGFKEMNKDWFKYGADNKITGVKDPSQMGRARKYCGFNGDVNANIVYATIDPL